MLPYIRDEFGNAASRSHRYGRAAQEAVEKARAQVATAINASDTEIVWTSGATESVNAALQGVAQSYAHKGKHIVTCLTEHRAVLDTCEFLESQGFEITRLEPDSFGRVDADQVRGAIRDDTILVSLMFANNETGTIHPIPEIGAACKEKQVFFHTDAAQALGRVPIDVQAMGIDLLSLSAHKVYGPKGVGALYVRRKDPRVRLQPIIFGGGHERGMRSGTLNVPGIVGCGSAVELAVYERPSESPRVEALRDRLWNALHTQLSDITINGHPEHRLPNTLNVSFRYIEGEVLMARIPDIAVSSGSACTSASPEPSHVLRAMGVPDDVAHGAIRFSLGRFTTDEEIGRTIEFVVKAVNQLRESSPLYEMARRGVDLSKVEWRPRSEGGEATG
jgi:cysteine desulfurase